MDRKKESVHLKILLVFLKFIFYIIKLTGWSLWALFYNLKRFLKIPIIFGLVLIGLYFLAWLFSEKLVLIFLVFFPISIIYFFRNMLSSLTTWIIILFFCLLYTGIIGNLIGYDKNGFEIASSVLTKMDVTATDKLYVALIKSGTKFLVFIIPITLTFFYFSYREQKSLSISLNGFWNYKMLAFIISSLFSIILGKHISLILSLNDTSIIKVEDYEYKIYLWLIFLFFTIMSGLSVVKDQMNNFNLNYQLVKNIEKMNIYLNLSYITYTKRQLAAYYSPLSRTVDSIYQLLFLATEKNMVQDYKNNFEKWSSTVSLIANEPRRIKYKDEIYSGFMLEMTQDTKNLKIFIKVF
ncbi:hypothetical protein [Paenibacillus sp. WLX2291]|uniref:hypothetical protein n=1 Tax=Paenibacillus sp. WLX2291 TaxID=3296934 RepID=UPI003984222A